MQTQAISETSEPVQVQAQRLLDILVTMKSVAVALSGGVDSAVVAKAAHLALGNLALAVTADSPSVPRADIESARNLAKQLNLRHQVIITNEFKDPQYVRNAGDRCYFCKSELYSSIERKLPELGVQFICSGANQDDLGDYRPGLQAAKEHGIRHPLQEAGLGKDAVRRIARFWNLDVWDKPASPCLSSRIAPGVEVSLERTGRIEQAELFLKKLGFPVCRVRLHQDELARIEIPVEDLPRFLAGNLFSDVSTMLRQLGFRFVCLDMEGLKSGGLNSLVPLEIMKRYKLEDSSRGES